MPWNLQMRFQIRTVGTGEVESPPSPSLILVGMEAKPSPSKSLGITTLPTGILDLPTALQKYEITKKNKCMHAFVEVHWTLGCEQINDYTYALFNGPWKLFSTHSTRSTHDTNTNISIVAKNIISIWCYSIKTNSKFFMHTVQFWIMS